MEVLVMSDTHGRISTATMLIEKFLSRGLTHVLHAGDCIKIGRAHV